jgi:hypothetical protein
MRKIQSKEDIEKKQKRNQIIIGVVMVSLLAFSTIGYALMNNRSTSSSADTTTDSGITFYKNSGYWVAEFESTTFAFQNLPSDLTDIEFETNLTLNDYYQSPLYFVNANEGATEVLTNLNSYILRYQEACLEGMNCTGDLPTKDCSNNVIIFEIGNESKITQDENCIYLTGDSIRTADKFLYKILGLI